MGYSFDSEKGELPVLSRSVRAGAPGRRPWNEIRFLTIVAAATVCPIAAAQGLNELIDRIGPENNPTGEGAVHRQQSLSRLPRYDATCAPY
jgi:hypothetical protein